MNSVAEQLEEANRQKENKIRGKSEVLIPNGTPFLIMKHVDREPDRSWTSNALQARLGLKRTTVNGALRRLLELGKLKNVGCRMSDGGQLEYLYRKNNEV